MSLLPVQHSESEYSLSGPMEDAGAPASSFRIERLLPFLLKFWWVPVLTVTLCLGAAVGYVLWKPPTFVAKAYMWEPVKLRLPEGTLFSEDVQNFLGTQTELLQSAPLRTLALERLGGLTNKVAVPRGRDGEPLPVDVRVTGGSKSSVFKLEAKSSQADYTHAYLNALMEVYLEYKRNIRKEVSGDTLASISEQVQRTERDLKEQQDILLAFQRTNNLAILQQEGTIAGGYLATLKTKFSDLLLEQRLLKATAIEREAAASGTTNATSDWIDAGSVNGTLERQSAFKELQLVKIQREKLSKHLRPKHPKIVKLDAEIDRGEKLIEIYRRQSREQLAAAQQTGEMKVESVQASIKEWETKVVEANSRIAEAERLKLNVQRFQNVYEHLNALVQNVGISRNIDQETLAVLEQATPAKRSYLQELGVLGAAVVGGFALGLGIVVLIGIRDDRFTSLFEVNNQLGQNILGQVPEVRSLHAHAALPLLEFNDPRHAYAESYRSLRSALLFMAIEGQRPKVILITSAVPDEGKSTVAANLARALALGGSRVVLVDADLRKGTLHSLMGLQREPGLADLLQQPDDLERAFQKNSLPNLSFIASGRVPSQTGDLFLTPAFDQILARLREQFEYVLIDSSPVFASDDATTLAPKVDGTLFVVRSRFSRAGPAREALELLYQRQAKVLGVIYNQADATARSYYSYKYTDYQLSPVNGQ